MHVNYRFLVEAAGKENPAKGTLLDVGCGKGDMVRLAAEKGWEARGIEYFGPGSGTNIRDALQERGLLGGTVLEYDGLHFPFPDGSFDVVLSNQVFEHVPDLDPVLSEIARVLKPQGKLLCTFPYQGAIREGHSNVLLAHWFPRSRARQAWLFTFRCMGVGRLKGRRTRRRWAEFFNDWLAENTFYLTSDQVHSVFGRHFAKIEHHEADYMSYRLADLGKHKLSRATKGRLLGPLAAWINRKFGSLVIYASK